MPISHFVKKIFLPSGDHGQILAPNSTDYYLDSALARNMWGGHFCPPPLTLPWLLMLLPFGAQALLALRLKATRVGL